MSEPLPQLIARTKAALEVRAAQCRDEAAKAAGVTAHIWEGYARRFETRAEDCTRWLASADNLRNKEMQMIRRSCREYLNLCAERITL